MQDDPSLSGTSDIPGFVFTFWLRAKRKATFLGLLAKREKFGGTSGAQLVTILSYQVSAFLPLVKKFPACELVHLTGGKVNSPFIFLP